MRTIEILNLGRVEYRDAYEYQRARVQKRQADEVPDCLIMVEHPPVITLGRGGGWNNIVVSRDFLRERGVEVFETERGGNVTFHGPGQLVGYPIIKLDRGERDLHRLLALYEEAIITAIGRYGIRGEHKPGLVGVWVSNRKIASIGVCVAKWVTFHGFAINVSVDMRWFEMINPCGLEASIMTSMEEVTGKAHSVEELVLPVGLAFAEVLGREPVYASIS
ncbi:MAG: lipoyl(octanoyl) transferase LipB [Firmicutes bacterium]|nr:lipoyl(octanoyl) transferase LipB [Bacillota bacterium]MDH7495706.1 lipoyl(octanoyl) transferase LipB [Bacillota bacterium]